MTTVTSLCSGPRRVIAANNDAQVRVFDAENFACLNHFSFDWSVNVSATVRDTLYKPGFSILRHILIFFASFVSILCRTLL